MEGVVKYRYPETVNVVFMHSGGKERKPSSVLPFTLFLTLVRFVEDLHEVFGHEVWFL